MPDQALRKLARDPPRHAQQIIGAVFPEAYVAVVTGGATDRRGLPPCRSITCCHGLHSSRQIVMGRPVKTHASHAGAGSLGGVFGGGGGGSPPPSSSAFQCARGCKNV